MIALLCTMGSGWAQSVEFDIDDDRAAEAGIDAAAVEGGLGTAIDTGLNLVDPTKMLEHYANAGAMAMKGMGVDYATNPKAFSVGGVLGSSVSGVPLGFGRGGGDLPPGGYAFMASLYGGVNLGMFTSGDDEGLLDRITLYANGMAFRPPANRVFRGSMYNFGVHAQAKLVGPVNAKVVEWGGLDLTTGYERSFYRLQLSQALPLRQSVNGNPVTWTATGDYEIATGSGSVPLELSTNLRVLLLTAYAGGAVDVAFASAASTASLSGPVEATVAGQPTALGDVGVTLDSEGSADPLFGRAFFGAQANLSLLKLFGHLNLGSNRTWGGFVGFRVAL
jgi:hypothetical protein